MVRKVAALAAAVVVGAGGSLGVQSITDGGNGQSASRTVYSFVYALKRHNYGRACGWYSQANAKRLGGYAACRLGFIGSVLQSAFFGDPEPYSDLYVVPGSEKELDGKVTFRLAFKGYADVSYTVTVVKTAAGNWRIERIR